MQVQYTFSKHIGLFQKDLHKTFLYMLPPIKNVFAQLHRHSCYLSSSKQFLKSFVFFFFIKNFLKQRYNGIPYCNFDTTEKTFSKPGFRQRKYERNINVLPFVYIRIHKLKLQFMQKILNNFLKVNYLMQVKIRQNYILVYMYIYIFKIPINSIFFYCREKVI